MNGKTPLMSGVAAARAGLLVLGLLLLIGCARSPEAQKARYLERGDQYAATEQYREAIIEYANVLRFDRDNARATRQLPVYQLGELAQAYRYLLKAKEQAPDDPELRLKLGSIYLLGGRRDEARPEALTMLAKAPNNLDALALLADTSTTPEDVDAAIRRFEEQPPTGGKIGRAHV